jgi:heme/copper-type cytochrome/quinol oxidase subunit 3
MAAMMALARCGATLAARIVNGAGRGAAAQMPLVLALLAALAAGGALLTGPWLTGLEPTAHAYLAIVWALALWTALHLATGALMRGYVVARSLLGRMTPEYDADIWNVILYWHFAVFGALVTAATIGGFPLVS